MRQDKISIYIESVKYETQLRSNVGKVLLDDWRCVLENYQRLFNDMLFMRASQKPKQFFVTFN